MSKSTVYNADGSTSSSSNTDTVVLPTYDRMDIGILLLNQAFPSGTNVYDFRVPGDSNNNTFRYRFPRAGFVLGLTMTGTLSATVTGGNYVQRIVALTGQGSDVMQPSDAGNGQTYDPTNFQTYGVRIMAPNPIPYAVGDIAQMKFLAQSAVTVSLAGFLLVALNPQ